MGGWSISWHRLQVQVGDLWDPQSFYYSRYTVHSMQQYCAMHSGRRMRIHEEEDDVAVTRSRHHTCTWLNVWLFILELSISSKICCRVEFLRNPNFPCVLFFSLGDIVSVPSRFSILACPHGLVIPISERNNYNSDTPIAQLLSLAQPFPLPPSVGKWSCNGDGVGQVWVWENARNGALQSLHENTTRKVKCWTGHAPLRSLATSFASSEWGGCRVERHSRCKIYFQASEHDGCGWQPT